MAPTPTPIPQPRAMRSPSPRPRGGELFCDEDGGSIVGISESRLVVDLVLWTLELVTLGYEFSELVVTPSTHLKPAEPMPLPVGKERQAPTAPLLTSGEIEGCWHPSRSDISRTGLPLSHVGRDAADIAVVSFVSRHLFASSGTDEPVGFWQLLSENSCTEP